jgi:hypothetical protein
VAHDAEQAATGPGAIITWVTHTMSFQYAERSADWQKL